MTLAVTLDHPEIPAKYDRFALGDAGDVCERTGSIAFDSSYPTGGESLTAADLGLDSILFARFEPTSGYLFNYDLGNSKVLAWYSDSDGVADGPLAQVPDTTDLAALTTVNFWVVGVEAP